MTASERSRCKRWLLWEIPRHQDATRATLRAAWEEHAGDRILADPQVTVTMALQSLKRDGMIAKRHGKGYNPWVLTDAGLAELERREIAAYEATRRNNPSHGTPHTR